MTEKSINIYRRNIKNPAFRNAIMEKFVTQDQFAKAAKVDKAIISRIVRGKRKPTLNQKEYFAELLQQPIEELFDD